MTSIGRSENLGFFLSPLQEAITNLHKASDDMNMNKVNNALTKIRQTLDKANTNDFREIRTLLNEVESIAKGSDKSKANLYQRIQAQSVKMEESLDEEFNNIQNISPKEQEIKERSQRTVNNEITEDEELEADEEIRQIMSQPKKSNKDYDEISTLLSLDALIYNGLGDDLYNNEYLPKYEISRLFNDSNGKIFVTTKEGTEPLNVFIKKLEKNYGVKFKW